ARDFFSRYNQCPHQLLTIIGANPAILA
ncbi:MAG: hypothetical protein QOF01_2222, partial [Thermomicrobiales bacterium]|nr:hypothetical protein [Thermomicrobiales bacterium]